MSKEKPSTKICKHCKSEIPYEAKVCPQCRKKQGSGCLVKILIGVIALIIVCVLLFGSDDSDTTSESTQDVQESTTTKKEEQVEEKTSFKAGESYEDEDIIISFLDAGEYESDNEFLQPEDGNKYVFAEFEIQNLDDTDLGIGSWSFSCYADDYACDEVFFDDNSLSAFDSISAGKKIKGKIYYEVPEDSEKINLEYEADYWTSKKINFIIK